MTALQSTMIVRWEVLCAIALSTLCCLGVCAYCLMMRARRRKAETTQHERVRSEDLDVGDELEDGDLNDGEGVETDDEDAESVTSMDGDVGSVSGGRSNGRLSFKRTQYKKVRNKGALPESVEMQNTIR